MAGGEDIPLVPSAHYAYRRQAHDRPWAVLYLLVWVGCIAGGVYGAMHMNPKFTLDPAFVKDPANCPYAGGRSLLEDKPAKEFDWPGFWHAASTWLLISVVGSLLVGVLFLQLFKRNAAAMTQATIWTQVAVPLVASLSLLFAGQGIPAAALAGLAAVTALVFWMWRNEIGLASNLLGVSAHGLVANPHLVTVTVVLNLLSLLLAAPLLVLQAISFTNGAYAPNPNRHGAAACVTPSGQEVPCCVWQPEGWVPPFIAVSGLLLLWTLLLANQIRVFTISGTIAQWYFAPASATGAARGSIGRSLKHALGPSFGSLCFSSAVLTVTETLRQATQNAQDQAGQEASLVQVCFYFCAQMLYALIEYLTKFATVMMAITGEAFLTAGRHATDLLLRNFLNAFASTVWFTPLVIQLACLSLSVFWGLLSGTLYYLLRPAGKELYHTGNSVALGVLSGVAALFVLSFLGGVLLSVLDATFMCWAIDRDSQTVSRPDVYEVFMAVPIKTPQGAVVQQPGGGLAYGAAAPEQEPLYQAAPGRPASAPPPPEGQAYQPPTVHHVLV